MFWLLILVPIIEVAVLIQAGKLVGTITTIGLIVFTAFLGMKLLRKQGLLIFNEAYIAINSGRIPAGELLAGVFVTFGGVLLLTPGFLTDLVGFILLIPQSRSWIICFLMERYADKIFSGREKFQDYLDHED